MKRTFFLLPCQETGTGSKSSTGAKGRNLELYVSVEPASANGSPDCIKVLTAPAPAVQGCRGTAHMACICHAELLPCAIIALMSYPGI